MLIAPKGLPSPAEVGGGSESGRSRERASGYAGGTILSSTVRDETRDCAIYRPWTLVSSVDIKASLSMQSQGRSTFQRRAVDPTSPVAALRINVHLSRRTIRLFIRASQGNSGSTFACLALGYVSGVAGARSNIPLPWRQRFDRRIRSENLGAVIGRRPARMNLAPGATNSGAQISLSTFKTGGYSSEEGRRSCYFKVASHSPIS
jgi:hypothetical protein